MKSDVCGIYRGREPEGAGRAIKSAAGLTPVKAERYTEY